MKQKAFSRGAGILLPVFSLPGKYGIGDFGSAAYRFVDFLSNAGQRYWQVLPMGPTGYGDSPYAAHSAFAGNPYFIPFEGESLFQNTEQAVFQLTEGDASRIDYARLYRFRNELLERYLRELPPPREETERFKERERFWLRDYALYRAIKNEEYGRSWLHWKNVALRDRDSRALSQFASSHKEEIDRIVSAQ